MKYLSLNFLSKILIFIFLSSCSHLASFELAETLFPPSTYRHSIEVTVLQTQQTYHFTGAIGLTQKNLTIYMMGPMDLSVMKISESFVDNNYKIENYFEPLKPYENYIQRLYPVLRGFLLYQKGLSTWSDLKVTERDSLKNPIRLDGPYGLHFFVKEYKNNHPSVFEISHEKFKAFVKEI